MAKSKSAAEKKSLFLTEKRSGGTRYQAIVVRQTAAMSRSRLGDADFNAEVYRAMVAALSAMGADDDPGRSWQP